MVVAGQGEAGSAHQGGVRRLAPRPVEDIRGPAQAVGVVARARDEVTHALAGVQPLPPQTFRASVGRRRVFLSMADVMAYEAGYRMFPCANPKDSGPWASGYMDHHLEVRDRL